MHKAIKQSITVLLSICLIISLLPISALAIQEEATYTTATGETQQGTLAEAVNNVVDSGTILLLRSVEVSSNLTIRNKTVTLLGGGHTITLMNNAYMELSGESVLQLGDPTLPEDSKLTVCSTDTLNPLIGIKDQSRLDMYDGVTLGPSVAYSTVAGVSVYDQSTFNMYGGMITSCVNNISLTGGVYVDENGQFHMYDGIIENCTGVHGGAVGLSGGSVIGTNPRSTALFHMHGGIIRNCTDGWYGGGAVCIYTSNPTRFIMDGGTITDCDANSYGYGGAVFVYATHPDAEVRLNGGKIIGNSAKNGGGIFVYAGEVAIGNSVQLYDNTATVSGSDLYINSDRCAVSLGADNAGCVLSECTHAIDGWYKDDSSYRWSCADSGNAIKYTLPAGGTISENLALKAAHGGIYAISVTPQVLDFGTETVGYAPLSSQTVTVRNTGNQTITLDQPFSEDYEIGLLSANVLAPNGTATFDIRPKTGLTENTYNETISIFTDRGVTETVNVSFNVMKPVTVTPENMTVYMGGSKGYNGVVGEENGNIVIQGSSSLPIPGFTIELPDTLEAALAASGEDITDLRFVSGTKQWKAVSYDGKSDTIYKLESCGFEGQDPVRVQFKDGDDLVVSDSFAVGEYINQTLDMSIYPGDLVTPVTITYDGYTYGVDSSAVATLTVRGTTTEVKTPIVAKEDTVELKEKEPAVTAPDGTIYLINGNGVQADPLGIALLFDSIIEEDPDSTIRTDALKTRGDETLGDVGANHKRHYEFKYLDLVDTNNGNTWVTAVDTLGNGQNVTVYWPLPGGTTKNTAFTLLHFEGLHRDMQSGQIQERIDSCTVNEVAIKNVTDTHVVLEIGATGFSPFALVWETRAGGGIGDGDGGSTGGGTSGGGTIYYTLSYESNGGTKYSNERYASGTTVELNKVPTREGYTFTGWYADSELTQKITNVKMTSNKTVYAGWKISGVPELLNGDDHFAYIIGRPDGTVGPEEDITRAEVATIFFRLLADEVRISNLTEENSFSDVYADDWYNTEVSTMEALGIFKGRISDIFDPNAPITRAEFAAICARFDTGRTVGDSNFTDIDGHWAEAEIERAVVLGWIAGYPDGTFRPDSYITRAEAMTMINRVLQRLPENENDLLRDMIVWPDNSPEDWHYLAVQEATNSHEFERKPDGIHESWTKLTEDPDWTQY